MTLYNIPQVAGVPAISAVRGIIPAALLTSDIVSPFSAVFGPQWGIFLGNAPVVTAESVTTFEYREDWTLSDYPVEGGIFESYDKVQIPYLAKIRFAAGGSVADREELLASVEMAAHTLSRYDIVTPEYVYLSANISHYDYRRTSVNGVGLIVIDVWVLQVLVQNSGALTGSNTQSPSAADSVQEGLVQPTSLYLQQSASYPAGSFN